MSPLSLLKHYLNFFQKAPLAEPGQRGFLWLSARSEKRGGMPFVDDEIQLTVLCVEEQPDGHDV